MNLLKRIWAFIWRYKWRVLIAAIILLPVGALALFALTPKQPEYITAVAERTDLTQTVEAVGTVISDRDLQLQFATTGIVAQVYVKEGDTVRAGQRLAALRAGNLSADVASAAARVAQAEADLRAKQEGARPEDIAISEAEVQSKRASLDAAKTTYENAKRQLEDSQRKLDALEQEARTSLSGYVSNAATAMSKELTAASNALSEVRNVFNSNDVIDAVVKYSPSEYESISVAEQQTSSQVTALFGVTASSADYEDALLNYEKTKAAVNGALSVVNRAFDLLNRLQVNSYFTEADRQAYKSDLATERSTLQTSLNTLDSSSKSLRDASANFVTRIATEEANVTSAKGTMDRAEVDITTYEAALRIAEAQLQLKRAPTRQTDIDAAAAALRQAQAALARASADYSNTILTAPISGRITKVNVKVGEYTPTGAAVTMLGDSPFQVEMYVSEIDIPKVHVTQSGSVELDAFRDVDFDLRVSEVDTAATDRDGVPKYRVRLDFVYPHDELKIGMTGDAVIVTGLVEDVVSVPLRAVLEHDDGTSYVRIQRSNGSIEERDVETGLEGEGGTVEVTGVEEGEVIIVLERS